jgi:hypothetical protein
MYRSGTNKGHQALKIAENNQHIQNNSMSVLVQPRYVHSALDVSLPSVHWTVMQQNQKLNFTLKFNFLVFFDSQSLSLAISSTHKIQFFQTQTSICDSSFSCFFCNFKRKWSVIYFRNYNSAIEQVRPADRRSFPLCT